MARIESGKYIMDETVTDIREFDRSICDVFENQLEQKGIRSVFCKFFAMLASGMAALPFCPVLQCVKPCLRQGKTEDDAKYDRTGNFDRFHSVT